MTRPSWLRLPRLLATRLAATEWRRLTAGRLPRVAVLALLCVPLLYGGLYLYANHDPYGRLDQVPAAVVDADAGAVDADGHRVDLGAQVSRTLVDGHSFDWHRVSAAEAERGVRDGRFDFALTLPADFSSAITSSGRAVQGDGDPRRALVVLTTNDANNYLARTIATTVTDRVRDDVARQVGEQAAGTFLTGFATVHDQLVQAVDGAERLAEGAQRADDGAAQLATGSRDLLAGQRRLLAGSQQLATGTARAAAGAGRLDQGTGELASGLGRLDRSTRSLPADTRQLADGAAQVAQGNRQVAQVGDRVARVAQGVLDGLDRYEDQLAARLTAAGLTPAQVDQVLAQVEQLRAPVTAANADLQQQVGQLDALASGSQRVAAGADRLADAAPALHGGIADAAAGARKVDAGADQLAGGTAALGRGAAGLRDGERTAVSGTSQLASGASTLAGGLDDLTGGARTLAERLRAGLGDVPDLSPSARDAAASTIGDPVAVRDVAGAQAGSYGAGLAPFFLALACWIGGYVLFLLVRPLSARALASNQSPLRVALAGWLTPAALGVVQATLLVAVVSWGLNIRPDHPLATWGLLALTSLAFIAIIHALNAWLGTAGQFLGLVLMVLQLVSAGGTFPWQTIPQPLHLLHHVLPMGYAIDGLRQLVYGGRVELVGRDVAVLVAYLVGSLLLTAVAARRLRVWTVSRIKPELVL